MGHTDKHSDSTKFTLFFRVLTHGFGNLRCKMAEKILTFVAIENACQNYYTLGLVGKCLGTWE